MIYYDNCLIITYVLGALKKRLLETFRLRTKNVCLIRGYIYYVYFFVIRTTDNSK